MVSQINQLPISSPLSLGDLLDRAFRLYRTRFGMLLLTAAIFLVPLGIISGIFTGNFMVGYMDLLENMNVDSSAPPEAILNEFVGPFLGYMGTLMLFSIIWMLVNGIVSLALNRQIISILHQNEQTLGQSLRIGWDRYWNYLLMNVLRFITILVVSIAIIVAIAVVGFIIIFIATIILGTSVNFLENSDLSSSAGIIGFIILICCGYFLAILAVLSPMIYLSARWVVAVPGIVEQKWQASESLSESWRLTQGNIWRCIGYLVLLNILSMVIVSLPQTLFQQLLTIVLPSEFTEFVFVISTVLGSLFNVVWQPFYIAAVVLLYYDLRVRKESYDLELQIQQLESEVEQPTL